MTAATKDVCTLPGLPGTANHADGRALAQAPNTSSGPMGKARHPCSPPPEMLSQGVAAISLRQRVNEGGKQTLFVEC